jgi:hypothetical protein
MEVTRPAWLSHSLVEQGCRHVANIFIVKVLRLQAATEGDSSSAALLVTCQGLPPLEIILSRPKCVLYTVNCFLAERLGVTQTL